MSEQAGNNSIFTIKQILLPLLAHPKIAFILKWSVYTFLFVNFVLYIQNDLLAWRSSLPEDASLSDHVQSFATTIDVAAWLILIGIFELETYALSDEAFTAGVNRLFQIIKVLCYCSIGYAAYGYVSNSLEFYELLPLGHIQDLCGLLGQGLSVQTDITDFVSITSDTCANLAAGDTFYQVAGQTNVFAAGNVEYFRWMGWLDFSNAIIWIIVVVLIDVEVHLQSADKFGSRRLTAVRRVKSFAYMLLICACGTWFVNGLALLSWDSFLWIFGFWAIELNLAEWEQDRVKELNTEALGA